MVIAHVITRLLRAGSEENTVATCLAQARAGHRTLLVHGKDWNPIHRVRCGSLVELVEVSELVPEINVRKDVAAVLALRRLFRRERPTVVHTHQSKAGILGRTAAKLAGVPVIIHGVHIVPFVGVGRIEQLVYLGAERAMAGFTDAFINVSESTRQTCLDFSVGRVEQHHVAYSGMDIGRYQRALPPDDWRALVGVPEGAAKPPVVLMLAALEKRKRHAEFLDVFGRVVERIPDVRLLLAGEGPTRDVVEARVVAHGLSANVKRLGFHANPERLIALADLTVLTSMREGLPRVVVQSLAGGRPVVTTDLPGVRELVRSGENGVVTPGDDLAGTASVVADLLQDRDRLARMQRRAADTDVSPWGVDTMCNVIAGIYERLVPHSDALKRGIGTA
jgi:glycosyltransferase involved in cell wall biosynthesis